MGGILGAVTAPTVCARLGLGRAVTVVAFAIAPAAVLIPLVGRGVPGPVAAAA